LLEGVAESCFVSESNLSHSDYDLEVLRGAEKYQRWILSQVAPYLGNRILEIGAGTGNMSRWLPQRDLLVLAEPRVDLRRQLQKILRPERSKCRFDFIPWQLEQDTAHALREYHFDTVISFNTLEHIDRDADVLLKLWNLLLESKAQTPKNLICFVPAHNWAFGSLDKTYGHYRRYDEKQFAALREHLGDNCTLKVQYFNPLGLMGWLFLGKVLRLTQLKEENITLTESAISLFKSFDRVLCKWMRLPLGQSLYAVFSPK